jgi:hypothetical protein
MVTRHIDFIVFPFVELVCKQTGKKPNKGDSPEPTTVVRSSGRRPGPLILGVGRIEVVI